MKTIKEIAQWVWMDCKNRHRLYPDNNHTFADWWATAAPDFDKFTLLKETPMIATDNTLPPSSPTATAEDILTDIINRHFYKPEKTQYYEAWVMVVKEFASLKEQEAHNRAVQECIRKVKDIGWLPDFLVYDGTSLKILEELEKLKK